MSITDDVKCAVRAAGLHYESVEAQSIIRGGTWDGTWPVVDGRGILTGEVVDSEDSGMVNIDDEVMCDFDDLPHECQSHIRATADNPTGYGWL